MSDVIKDKLDAFFAQGEREVDEFLDRLCKTSVELNKTNGNYRNRTGNLRRSNYSKVHDHTLTLGNKAEYASDVSSRGYDVIDSGIQYIKKEIEDMVSICKPAGVICKVILETCYLTDEEKETVCRIAKEAGVDFVKTSTGFGTAGATVHDVALMRRVVGPTIGVKAAGGIRDLDSALALIQAGATRLGTSSGIQIVESYKELKKGL